MFIFQYKKKRGVLERDIFFDPIYPGRFCFSAFGPPLHRLKFKGQYFFKGRQHGAFHQCFFLTGHRSKIDVNLLHLPAFDLLQGIQVNLDQSFEFFAQQRLEGFLCEVGVNLLELL